MTLSTIKKTNALNYITEFINSSSFNYLACLGAPLSHTTTANIQLSFLTQTLTHKNARETVSFLKYSFWICCIPQKLLSSIIQLMMWVYQINYYEIRKLLFYYVFKKENDSCFLSVSSSVRTGGETPKGKSWPPPPCMSQAAEGGCTASLANQLRLPYRRRNSWEPHEFFGHCDLFLH